MYTKADRLLNRIQYDVGFEPRSGDVFKTKRRPGIFVVVAVGRRSALDEEPRIVAFQYHRREWKEWAFIAKYWGMTDPHNGVDTSDFRLVDVARADFIFGGFSPYGTGSSYVIFKQAAGAILRAGCRRFTTYAQAARHWRDNGYSNMARDKRAIAKNLFEQARRRGWLKVKRDRPVKKKAVRR